MTDSNLYECKDTAGMWHDGQRAKEMKFVIRNCKFDGVEGWSLARHHHDAHFYFLDCAFPNSMVDKAPFRVVYPLNAGVPTQADIDRNKSLDPSNIWGERAYYFNNHRIGGDYGWFKDNLDQAPGSPKAADITAKWTFDGTWNPEDSAGPTIVDVTKKDGKIQVKFAESVTAKGKPYVTLAGGATAPYDSGSGSDTLVFPGNGNPASIDLNGGKIIATIATAAIRGADLTLPR
jgi:pectinesterase